MSDPTPEPVMIEHPDDDVQGGGVIPVGAGGSRRRKRRGLGCLPVLIVLAVLGGLLYVGVTKGVEVLRDQFSEAEDFAGPGRGDVDFEVQSGDTSTDIGRNLKDLGVVASVDAFVAAANGEPRAGGIQVGFYPLKKQMSAEDALQVLVDPANIISNAITFPEGLRVVDIVDIFVDKTDFKRRDFEKVLDNPGKLGLPGYAGGNAEGYLFPSTYGFGPNETPESMLTAMVDRWKQAADDAGLEDAAAELGLSPHELMTVASLVEAEGRGEAMSKISRVIYNRLDDVDGPTIGRLQIDATVNYALDRELVAIPTLDDLEVDSPYNTYANAGLPPGPIEAPGDAAIQAASDPADGDWLFYVTVDLETGETKFTESYEEFLDYKNELRDYCATQSDRC